MIPGRNLRKKLGKLANYENLRVPWLVAHPSGVNGWLVGYVLLNQARDEVSCNTLFHPTELGEFYTWMAQYLEIFCLQQTTSSNYQLTTATVSAHQSV